MCITELRCLHRIELKKPAQRKLTSTRRDVNGIQRRGEQLLRKNEDGERRLLQIDESAGVAASGCSDRNGTFCDSTREQFESRRENREGGTSAAKAAWMPRGLCRG
jgi:hypothetical protein